MTYKVVAICNPSENVNFQDLEELFADKPEQFPNTWLFTTIEAENGNSYIAITTTEMRGFIRASNLIAWVGITDYGKAKAITAETLNSELGGSIIADISEIDGTKVIRLLQEATETAKSQQP